MHTHKECASLPVASVEVGAGAGHHRLGPNVHALHHGRAHALRLVGLPSGYVFCVCLCPAWAAAAAAAAANDEDDGGGYDGDKDDDDDDDEVDDDDDDDDNEDDDDDDARIEDVVCCLAKGRVIVPHQAGQKWWSETMSVVIRVLSILWAVVEGCKCECLRRLKLFPSALCYQFVAVRVFLWPSGLGATLQRRRSLRRPDL